MMTKFLLDDIKKKVDELAEKISAPIEILPTYGYSRDLAFPHIEIDDSGLMHYLIIERGQELNRKTTHCLDVLLYWIFSDITFSIACKYELSHRVENKDSRRIIFDKQKELLGILSITWQEKENEKHKTILKNYPFDDLSLLRATYCGQLRKRGYSERKIDKLSYEKYPKN